MEYSFSSGSVIRELGIENELNKKIEHTTKMILENKKICEEYFGEQWQLYLPSSLINIGDFYVSKASAENKQKVETMLRKQGYTGNVDRLLSIYIVNHIVQNSIERGFMDKGMLKTVDAAKKMNGRFLGTYLPENVIKELEIEGIVNEELNDIANKLMENKSISEKHHGEKWPLFLTYSLFSVGKYFLARTQPKNIQKMKDELEAQGFEGKTKVLLSMKITEYIVNSAIERKLMSDGMLEALDEMCAWYGRYPIIPDLED